MKTGAQSCGLLGILIAALLLSAAPAAGETLAYVCGGDICSIDPDAPFMPMDITQSTNLTEDYPSWSPDGSTIAFEAEGPGGYDDVYATAGTRTTGTAIDVSNTADYNESGRRPQWSLSGTYLAFDAEHIVGASPYPTESLVARSDGTSLAPTVLNGGSPARYPNWLADSARVSFLAGGGNTYVQSLGGNPPTAPFATSNKALSWSPDGARVLTLTSNNVLEVLPTADPSATPVVLGTLNGTTIPGDDIGVSGNWTKVAWNDRNVNQVRVAPTDGSSPATTIQNPTGAAGSLYPALSYDGTRVSFTAFPGNGTQQTYVGPSDGSSAPVAVTNGASDSVRAVWKPTAQIQPPPGGGGGGSGGGGGGGGAGGGGGRSPVVINFATNRIYNPYHLSVVINCHVDGFTSSDPACQGSGKGFPVKKYRSRVTVAARPSKHPLALTAKKMIPAGKAGQLKFKVTKVGRKLFKPGKIVKVKLSVVVQSGGARTAKSEIVSVKASSRKP